MEIPQLTFDQWAEAIGVRVLEAFPAVCFKRKIEDVYRWTYHGRECQLHAVSDSRATFVALFCGQRAQLPHRSATVDIADGTQDEIASRIIGWFER